MLLIKFEVAQLFREFCKVLREIYSNKLSRDNEFDLVKNYHLTMDLLHPSTAHYCKASDREGRLNALENILSAGMNVQDNCKMVLEDVEADAHVAKRLDRQSHALSTGDIEHTAHKSTARGRKRFVLDDTNCPDSTVIEAFVISNVHQAESQSPVQKTGFKTIANKNQVGPKDVKTANRISTQDYLQYTEVEITFS